MPSKVFPATYGTTARAKLAGGGAEGSGGNVRCFVGSDGTYDYLSYMSFTPDWGDGSPGNPHVGKIVSAVLSIWTDDGFSGIFAENAVASPMVYFRMLGSGWSEHSHDTSFTAGDFTSATALATGAVNQRMTGATSTANNVDITAMVTAWAPRSVVGGLNAPLYGLGLFHPREMLASDRFAAFSQHWADPTVRPYITLTYEIGASTPNVPDTLTPTGSIAGFSDFQGNFTDPKAGNVLYASEVEVYSAGATNVGQVVSGGALMYDSSHTASNTEVVNARFDHIPDSLALVAETTYKWRARVYNQDQQVSLWSDLVSFLVTNTAPDAPTLTPSGQTYATLQGVQFSGSFHDADGDALLAYQVQLGTDSGLSNPLWDTGKVYVAAGATDWQTPYGGQPLSAATYYWRARVWDSRQGISVWSASVTITLTADFVISVTDATTTIQQRIRVPFRIAIKEMAYDTMAGTTTGVAASTNAFTHTAHGLVNDQTVRFSALTGGTGVLVGATYYVISATANTFQISLTQGGVPVSLTTAVSAATITSIVLRGPGKTVGMLEDAQNAGASLLYNSPGEAHWTLTVVHPQLSVIEPRQTHYSVQFWQGDGWREVFAGLVWDYDATDTDIIFYGVDYLALLSSMIDERYNPAQPDLPAERGGSKYVTTGKNSIAYIVADQLAVAKALPYSPVGFITVGTIDPLMTETLAVWSTYAPTLDFIVGLLDSHRAGQGIRTRLYCHQKSDGSYEWVVDDAPGAQRDNLRLRYGELVQGYRVIPFGKAWASRVAGVGRTKEGVKVMYHVGIAPGVNEAVWGRFSTARLFDGVADDNDMIRKVQQAAIQSAKLGSSMGIGIRTGILNPLDGYDLCDQFPIDIEHGAVNTQHYGSGYWVAVGVTWTSSGPTGQQNVILTLQPREDDTPPSNDLLTLSPLSTQADWQIGWRPPTLTATTPTSHYYLDQSTGIPYVRGADGVYVEDTQVDVVPAPPDPPTGVTVTSTPLLQTDGTISVWVKVAWTDPVSASARSIIVRTTTTP